MVLLDNLAAGSPVASLSSPQIMVNVLHAELQPRDHSFHDPRESGTVRFAGRQDAQSHERRAPASRFWVPRKLLVSGFGFLVEVPPTLPGPRPPDFSALSAA